MEYPKINSLWKRNPDTHKFIIGDYSLDEFASISKWRVEEKIDGTNVRFVFKLEENDTGIGGLILGRSKDAQLSSFLMEELRKSRNSWNVYELAKKLTHQKFVLFGEGYGPKIQNGGNYIDKPSFILFDVWAGRWSTREEVKEIANLLNLRTPHDYGMMTTQEIIDFVKSKPQSPTAIKPRQIEGVICRTEPLMLRNLSRENPVMFKLKCKDFDE